MARVAGLEPVGRRFKSFTPERGIVANGSMAVLQAAGEGSIPSFSKRLYSLIEKHRSFKSGYLGASPGGGICKQESSVEYANGMDGKCV